MIPPEILSAHCLPPHLPVFTKVTVENLIFSSKAVQSFFYFVRVALFYFAQSNLYSINLTS